MFLSVYLLFLLVHNIQAAFIVSGKGANRRQEMKTNSIHDLNFAFFAEIFLNNSDVLNDCSLTGPGDASKPILFPDTGAVRFIIGGRFDNEHALNTHFPDGTYWIHYNITRGVRLDQSVFIKKIHSHDHIPAPIRFTLFQGGKQIEPESISPNADLDLRWTSFLNGGPDPNHICPDLEFVKIGDCWGNTLLETGIPFLDYPSSDILTYQNTSFTIPASILKPGQTFQLSIEQSKLMTSKKQDIPALGDFLTTTFLDFKTKGSPPKIPCPLVPYQMDGGQTDRPKKKNSSHLLQ